MRPLLLRAIVFAVLAVVWMGAGSAAAHVLPQERKIVAQVSADRVELLIEYLEPPNDRVELLLQHFDLDGDGELRGPEAKLAGGAWAKYMLNGLRFEVVGEAPAAHEPEIKFRREKKGALTSLLYIRWDLPELKPGATRTLRITTDPHEQVVPTALSVSPGEQAEVREIAVPVRFRANIPATVLKPGEQAHLRVQRGPVTDPQGAGER